MYHNHRESLISLLWGTTHHGFRKPRQNFKPRLLEKDSDEDRIKAAAEKRERKLAKRRS
jgi:hypothetical protein